MLPEGGEVGRECRLEAKNFACDGMDETEFGSVEGETRCAAGVGSDFAEARLTINFFAADGITKLRKMDANLMCAASFKAALNESVVGTLTPSPSPAGGEGSNVFQRLDVGDGFFARGGFSGAAAAAIATIANKTSADSLRFDLTDDDCQIAAMGGVLAKLFGKGSFGSVSTSEDDKAAGVAIDTVDGGGLGAECHVDRGGLRCR